MHHWCEQLRMQGRVTETLLETVSLVIAMSTVFSRFSNFLVRRNVVRELRAEGLREIQFEDKDEDDWWYG